MADVIDYKIYGEDLQLVEVYLDPGEGVQAEIGTMTYMSDNVHMNTGPGGGGIISGLFSGFKRALSGDGFFITTFAYNGPAGTKGQVGFAAPYPGEIIPLNLGELGGEMLCQKDSFLCAAAGTNISVAFTKKLRASLFGGEGFILQSLKGDGMAFAHAGGTIVEKNLAPGEVLRAVTGSVVAFAPTVTYSISYVRGFTNKLLGVEGMFFTKLIGPGQVYLQSMPFDRLAGRIYAVGEAAKKAGTPPATGTGLVEAEV